MKRRNSFFRLSLVLLIVSFSLQLKAQNEEPVVKKDIAYKVVNDSSICLDIYSNKDDSTTTTPVIVYIHGGSWLFGSKSWVRVTDDHKAMLKAIMSNHYRMVSIDYRLANGRNYTFKDELEDCRDAIKWIRRNAVKYHFDGNNIALWGASAGAHLSLVVGYEPTDSTDVKFIINDYGPTDLNKLFRKHLNFIALGMAHLIMPKMYKMRSMMFKVFPGDYCDRYSPVNMVKKHSIPTITFHGEKDTLVPVKQAKDLTKQLNEKGEDNKLVLFPNAVHAFPKLSADEIKEDVTETMAFCKKYFK
jgi:acetyl esterase/lipase